MYKVIEEVKRIAENIKISEQKRKKLAEFLKAIGPDTKLKYKLEKGLLDNLKIVGIDGGIVKKSLHGFDLILVRAAGVCFNFQNGKISNVNYYPSKIPSPKPLTLESMSDIDYAYFASISRQSVEINTARECIKQFQPDILLLDGSIVPHYTTKPAGSSEVSKNYESLIEDYKKLYKEAEENDVILAGVVEDSRSERFCEVVRNEILSKINHQRIAEMNKLIEKSRDTTLLYWVLEQGEKTQTFDYCLNPQAHQILKDFDKAVYSFYLKTAKWDRPVRVDLLRPQEADNLASILLAISGQHSRYGFPSVLIEADGVAKLSESEIDNLIYHILKHSGNVPSLMKLRRDDRPF